MRIILLLNILLISVYSYSRDEGVKYARENVHKIIKYIIYAEHVVLVHLILIGVMNIVAILEIVETLLILLANV